MKQPAGLAAADWAVIAALLLGVLAAGLYFSRRAGWSRSGTPAPSRRASGESSRLPGPTGPEGMPPPGPV